MAMDIELRKWKKELRNNPSCAILDMEQRLQNNDQSDKLYPATQQVYVVLLEHDRKTGVSLMLQKSRRLDRELTQKYNSRYVDRKKLQRQRNLAKNPESEESFMQTVARAKQFLAENKSQPLLLHPPTEEELTGEKPVHPIFEYKFEYNTAIKPGVRFYQQIPIGPSALRIPETIVFDYLNKSLNVPYMWFFMLQKHKNIEELSKLELVSGGEVSAAVQSFIQSLPKNPPGFPVAVYKEVSSDFQSNEIEFLFNSKQIISKTYRHNTKSGSCIQHFLLPCSEKTEIVRIIWKQNLVEPLAYLLQNKNPIDVKDVDSWYIQTGKSDTYDIYTAKHEDFITPKSALSVLVNEMENVLGFSFNTVIADYIQTSENNWYMLEIKDFELKENVIRNKKKSTEQIIKEWKEKEIMLSDEVHTGKTAQIRRPIELPETFTKKRKSIKFHCPGDICKKQGNTNNNNSLFPDVLRASKRKYVIPFYNILQCRYLRQPELLKGCKKEQFEEVEVCQKCFNYYSEFVKRQRFCQTDQKYDPIMEKITKERASIIHSEITDPMNKISMTASELRKATGHNGEYDTDSDSEVVDPLMLDFMV